MADPLGKEKKKVKHLLSCTRNTLVNTTRNSDTQTHGYVHAGTTPGTYPSVTSMMQPTQHEESPPVVQE